jgi:MFS family permease
MTDPETADSRRERQYKLGPIKLSEGVRPYNAIAVFYSAMMTIVFITVLNLLQPFILHEHLGMDTSVQGDFTGNLYIFTEIVSLALVVPLGILSDKIGRRPIMVSAFVLFGLGLIAIPLATSKELLVVARLITAAAAACGVVMIASLLADYPDNSARGKMISVNGVCTGLGIVLIASFGLAQLPGFFTGRGFEPVEAGRYSFWIAAAIALVSALIAWLGIKGGRAAVQSKKTTMLQSMHTGFHEIRKNQKLILASGATFVSRGDLTVLASFFSLWVVAIGTDQGMDAADAQASAGRLFGISQIAMIFFVPVIGMMADRIDRVTTLAFSMGLAAVGYTALGVVGDPFGSPWIYPVALLAGMGEAGVIISTPALVGQEAPKNVRGSVIGFVAFAGAIGVLVNVKVSGLLFDTWIYQAPFLWMGAMNFVVFVWALLVRFRFPPTASRTG